MNPVTTSLDSVKRMFLAPPKKEMTVFGANHLNDLGKSILYKLACLFLGEGFEVAYEEHMKLGMECKVAEHNEIRDMVRKKIDAVCRSNDPNGGNAGLSGLSRFSIDCHMDDQAVVLNFEMLNGNVVIGQEGSNNDPVILKNTTFDSMFQRIMDDPSNKIAGPLKVGAVASQPVVAPIAITANSSPNEKVAQAGISLKKADSEKDGVTSGALPQHEEKSKKYSTYIPVIHKGLRTPHTSGVSTPVRPPLRRQDSAEVDDKLAPLNQLMFKLSKIAQQQEQQKVTAELTKHRELEKGYNLLMAQNQKPNMYNIENIRTSYQLLSIKDKLSTLERKDNKLREKKQELDRLQKLEKIRITRRILNTTLKTPSPSLKTKPWEAQFPIVRSMPVSGTASPSGTSSPSRDGVRSSTLDSGRHTPVTDDQD